MKEGRRIMSGDKILGAVGVKGSFKLCESFLSFSRRLTCTTTVDIAAILFFTRLNLSKIYYRYGNPILLSVNLSFIWSSDFNLSPLAEHTWRNALGAQHPRGLIGFSISILGQANSGLNGRYRHGTSAYHNLNPVWGGFFSFKLILSNPTCQYSRPPFMMFILSSIISTKYVMWL